MVCQIIIFCLCLGSDVITETTNYHTQLTSMQFHTNRISLQLQCQHPIVCIIKQGETISAWGFLPLIVTWFDNGFKNMFYRIRVMNMPSAQRRHDIIITSLNMSKAKYIKVQTSISNCHVSLFIP